MMTEPQGLEHIGSIMERLIDDLDRRQQEHEETLPPSPGGIFS